MFKRVVWMGVGVAAGSAGTVWAQKKVRTQIERATEMLTPTHAGRVVLERVEGVGDRVRIAVAEGRSVMAETEADLRDRVNARTGAPAPAPARASVVSALPARSSPAPPARGAGPPSSRSW